MFEDNIFFNSKMEFESALHHTPVELKTDPNNRYVRSTFSIVEFLPGEFMKRVLSLIEDENKKPEVVEKTKNYSLGLQMNTNFMYQLEGEKIEFRYE